jgi:HEAT repeat protein
MAAELVTDDSERALSEADGELCIGYLFDKKLPWNDRCAAAESLMWYRSTRACVALFQVLMDPTEEEWMREEAVASLGSLWTVLGINYEQLARIPDKYVKAAVEDFPLEKVRLVPALLGGEWPRIASLLRGSDWWDAYVDWLEGVIDAPPVWEGGS